MKNFLLIAIALAAMVGANATTDNEYIRNVSSGDIISSDLCLPINGSITVTFNSIQDLNYFRWIPLGDLAFAEGSSAGDTTVSFVSSGYGKGTIRLQYRNGGCTSASMVDVYKQFTLPDTFAIAGPTCIAPGDVVVYSIDPILTVNLDHNIGMDNYFWSINENKPSFVDSIYYTAGDGSSVTFKVGTLTGNDILSVNVGKCNKDDEQKRISLTLGKLAPKPTIPTDTCIAYGTNSFTLSVQNAVDGVTYTWTAPSNYRLSSTTGASVTVTPDAGSSAEIKVTAAYTDEPACSESASTIVINRKWGTTTSISSNAQCAEVAANKYYTFRLEGQIPTNTSIRWELPQGWALKENTSDAGQTIEARPFENAALTGVVKAWSLACVFDGETVDTIKYTINVKPAAINEIHGDDCLKVGQTYKFWIDTAGVRPAARSFVWTAPGCNLTTYTGDTVYITPTTATTYLRVTPQGATGCNANYTQRNLSFAPTAPSTITMSGTSCIASNMPDTVTFSLSGTISNQTYNWILPTGWTQLSTNAAQTQISVRTNGVAGTHTVSAFAIGTSTCGNSDTITYAVEISQLSAAITYNVSTEAYTLPRGMSSYHWYLLHNGTLVTGAFESTTGRIAAYTDSYYQLGDLENSTEYTVVAEVVLSNGCKERYTYGAPINSENSYNSAPQSRTFLNRQKATTLIVSPNPTTNNVNIALQDSNDQSFRIKVVNMNGAVVYSADGLSSYNIDVSTLPDGQYIVMAYTTNSRISTKFIKN